MTLSLFHRLSLFAACAPMVLMAPSALAFQAGKPLTVPQSTPAATPAAPAAPMGPAATPDDAGGYASTDEYRNALNNQQAARARADADAQNEQRAQYEADLDSHRAAVDQAANDRAAYEARRAEVARQQDEYRAALAQHAADVAACEAGDYARCAPRTPNQ